MNLSKDSSGPNHDYPHGPTLVAKSHPHWTFVGLVAVAILIIVATAMIARDITAKAAWQAHIDAAPGLVQK